MPPPPRDLQGQSARAQVRATRLFPPLRAFGGGRPVVWGRERGLGAPVRTAVGQHSRITCGRSGREEGRELLVHLPAEGDSRRGWDAWFVFQGRPGLATLDGRVDLDLEGLDLQVSVCATELEAVMNGDTSTADQVAEGRHVLIERWVRVLRVAGVATAARRPCPSTKSSRSARATVRQPPGDGGFVVESAPRSAPAPKSPSAGPTAAAQHPRPWDGPAARRARDKPPEVAVWDPFTL